MVDFLFDGTLKIISEPPTVGDTTARVARDLYSAWKRWVATGVGSPFDPAFSLEGGTPIGATGLFTGTTFILINGWKIRPADHDHQLFLDGNLYSDDGRVAIPALTSSTTVVVNASTSAQGIATGSSSGVTPAIEAKLDRAVDFARAAAIQTMRLEDDGG